MDGALWEVDRVVSTATIIHRPLPRQGWTTHWWMREEPLLAAAETVFQVFIIRPKRMSHKVKTPEAVPVTTQACLLSGQIVVMGPL